MSSYTAIILLGCLFIGIQLYILNSMSKRENGDNFLLSQTQIYAIQLRIEKLFGWIHTRKD